MKQTNRIIAIAGFILGSISFMHAQSMDTEVSYDTVYLGNYLGLRYTLYNWEGQLQEVDFGDFTLVAGPNTSSSISISGNERKSKRSFTFILNPPADPGDYSIPSIKIVNSSEEKWTEEKKIVVLENPGNVQQNPQIQSNNSFNFQNQPSAPTPPKRNQRQKF